MDRMIDDHLQSIALAEISQGEPLAEVLLTLNNAHAQELSWLKPEFRARYPHFIYVDRIVVASSARGRGHARRLYDDLFEHARGAGHERVVCEVNTIPPTPESDAFHAALGFVEVGTASIHGDSKTVRYLSRTLPTRRS
jgi:uncharacterized protein